MKIGMIAFSTNTGLGNQTFAFYKHMKPHKTLLVDLSRFNHMETHHDRFPDAQVVQGIPECGVMDWLTDDIDILFICETPLNYCVMEKAKRKGVPVVLQYNYEFLDYLQRTDIEAPAVFAAPSSWNKNMVESLNIAPVIDLPVPTDVSDIEFREITECRTIMHVAGRQAIHDRNGTITFIKAALKCGNRFKYQIFAQTLDAETDRLILQAQKTIDLEVIYDIENYEDMYNDADLVVLPRKYGGLCLPMNEALSHGIPVVMSNTSPNDAVLPAQWLVKAEKRGSFMTRTNIDLYETDVDHLAFKMCQFGDEEYMQWSVKEAQTLGKALRWENLKPLYETIFQQIINN